MQITTPGPWTAEKYPAGHHGIFQQNHAFQVGEIFNYQLTPEEAKANADLIAAAPDLLAACEEALRRTPSYSKVIGPMLEAAIAKARGTSRQNSLTLRA